MGRCGGWGGAEGTAADLFRTNYSLQVSELAFRHSTQLNIKQVTPESLAQRCYTFAYQFVPFLPLGQFTTYENILIL
jgi:hypothetical protein